MNVIKSKWKSILACSLSLIMALACFISVFTVLNLDTKGQKIEFAVETGTDSIEGIGEAYNGSGVFVTSFIKYETGEVESVARKLGKNNAVEFECALKGASEESVNDDGSVTTVKDNGVFRSVFGISENRVLAFTQNWWYLYELKDNGLTLLDAVNADLDVAEYTYNVNEDGSVDIFNAETRGSSSTAQVFLERIRIENDKFSGGKSGELQRRRGNRGLTRMGAVAKGIGVTADGSKAILILSNASAYIFDADLSAVDITDADEYAEKVSNVTLAEGAMVTSTVNNYGKGGIFVAMQDGTLRLVTENDFTAGSEPDVIIKTAEYGSYTSIDRVNGIVFLTNEDGNTVYAVDVENRELVFSTQLQFKIRSMVAAESTDTFCLRWINSVTDLFTVTSYSYSALNMMDSVKVWRIVLIVIGSILAVLGILLLAAVLSEAFARVFKEKVKWFFGNVWKSKFIYIIMLPSFTLLVLFSLYPSIASVINSFFDYELGKPKIFIGLENYRELFVYNSGLLLEIARNTVLMVLTYLFTHIIPPVLYAYIIMLLRNKNSVKYIRLFLYIPGLLPTIATMLMWRYGIYGINPDGAINTIIKWFGGTPIAFLGDAKYAIWSVLFIGFPWVGGFLLFYGALMNVPGEVYDACELDGCGIFKRFFHIDLPFIMGQVKYVSIGALIAGVKAVGRVMATTDGQLGTMTMMYKLYDYVNMNRYGMASAIAVLMVILLAGISIVRVKKMLKKEATYD